ncbi:hypothetical protein BC828DRAFT_420397 [Blastocladiella britannica]|nr:hypothetical protein BC828DRAFT_420397 [Blastocladiella britannica]
MLIPDLYPPILIGCVRFAPSATEAVAVLDVWPPISQVLTRALLQHWTHVFPATSVVTHGGGVRILQQYPPGVVSDALFEVILAAARANDLDVLAWCRQTYDPIGGFPTALDWQSPRLADAIGFTGRLSAIQWFISGPWSSASTVITNELQIGATRGGHLHVLEWLVPIYAPIDVHGVFEGAVVGGSLAVLEWLKPDLVRDSLTAERIDAEFETVCAYGHGREVLDWFWTQSMRSSGEGHLFAHYHGCVDTALRNGHLGTVLWWWDTYCRATTKADSDLTTDQVPFCTLRGFRGGSQHGTSLALVQWLKAQSDAGLLFCQDEQQDMSMIPDWTTPDPYYPTEPDLSVDVFGWWVAHAAARNETLWFGGNVSRDLSAAGNIAVLDCMWDRYVQTGVTPVIRAELWEAALVANQVRSLEWLRARLSDPLSRRLPMALSPVVQGALKKESFDAIVWCYREHILDFSGMQYSSLTTASQVGAVEFLETWAEFVRTRPDSQLSLRSYLPLLACSESPRIAEFWLQLIASTCPSDPIPRFVDDGFAAASERGSMTMLEWWRTYHTRTGERLIHYVVGLYYIPYMSTAMVDGKIAVFTWWAQVLARERVDPVGLWPKKMQQHHRDLAVEICRVYGLTVRWVEVE